MKKFLPYIVAVATFAVTTVAIFAPQLEGRELRMHDVVQYEGSARDIIDHQQTLGEDPQWTGASFSGMPAVMVNMKYPGHWLGQVQKLFRWGAPGSLIFMAMLAFFAMLVLMRVSPWAAIAPALAYGLSTYFVIIIAVGHITKMIALAYAPLLVGAVWYTLRRDVWVGGALSALFGGLLISANHPQITYYFLFIVAALWLNEICRGAFLKKTLVLVVAAVLAVGANLAPLWYTMEYSRESTRGGSGGSGEGLDIEYATQWSYGVGETFNLYIPNLYGGSSEGNFARDGKVAEALTTYGQRGLAVDLPSYFGPQPMTSGPTYLGASVLFLAILALFWFGRRRTGWVVAVSVLAIMLAWGNHFMWLTRLFFEWFPAYSKFRTVSMTLVIVEFTVPLLAAWAINGQWSMVNGQLERPIRRTLYILWGVGLFFLLFGGWVLDFASPVDGQLPEDVAAAMRGERAQMMRLDALRSMLFVGLAAGAVWLYVRGKIKRDWMVAGLIVIVFTDMVAVDARFLKHSDFVYPKQTEIEPTEADLQILQDKGLGYRVMNLTVSPFNDATTSMFHRSVGGYSAAKLGRYQDVIDKYLNDLNPVVLGKLNVKYLITPEGVVENPDALGAAWFVAGESTDDIGKPALIDSAAHVELTEYRPNYLKYEYTSPRDAVAVFSEIYYPHGWTALIDGTPADHFRTEYVLRGMLLPAGSHTVEFRYRAVNFELINGLTLGATIFIIISLIAAWLVRKKD